MHAKHSNSDAVPVMEMMPNPAPAAVAAPIASIRNDFIPHPAQFPLRYRRRSHLPWRPRDEAVMAGDVGVSFRADEYVPAGTRLEVEIPLRGQVQRFAATVVMVRELPKGFELGLWFTTPRDAVRARIVEKICHTECALRARHAVAN